MVDVIVNEGTRFCLQNSNCSADCARAMRCPHLVVATVLHVMLHVAAGKLVMQRDSTPTGFTLGPAANPSQSVSFDLFLRQPKESRLIEIATAVSDPNHADYGKHLLQDEVKALMQPSAEDVAVVKSWVHRAGGKTHQVSESCTRCCGFHRGLTMYFTSHSG